MRVCMEMNRGLAATKTAGKKMTLFQEDLDFRKRTIILK